MEFFYSTELTIPAIQIALLLALNTLSLFFGRTKLALMITYLFSLYWGYILNREYLMSSGAEEGSWFTWVYFGFGIFVVILALAGLLSQRK